VGRGGARLGGHRGRGGGEAGLGPAGDSSGAATAARRPPDTDVYNLTFTWGFTGAGASGVALPLWERCEGASLGIPCCGCLREQDWDFWPEAVEVPWTLCLLA